MTNIHELGENVDTQNLNNSIAEVSFTSPDLKKAYSQLQVIVDIPKKNLKNHEVNSRNNLLQLVI